MRSGRWRGCVAARRELRKRFAPWATAREERLRCEGEVERAKTATCGYDCLLARKCCWVTALVVAQHGWELCCCCCWQCLMCVVYWGNKAGEGFQNRKSKRAGVIFRAVFLGGRCPQSRSNLNIKAIQANKRAKRNSHGAVKKRNDFENNETNTTPPCSG